MRDKPGNNTMAFTALLRLIRHRSIERTKVGKSSRCHIIEDLYPPSACDPRVRIVRFNLLTGSPVEQHNMEGLTEKLRLSAAMHGQPLRPVEGYSAAAQCSEHPAQSHT